MNTTEPWMDDYSWAKWDRMEKDRSYRPSLFEDRDYHRHVALLHVIDQTYEEATKKNSGIENSGPKPELDEETREIEQFRKEVYLHACKMKEEEEKRLAELEETPFPSPFKPGSRKNSGDMKRAIISSLKEALPNSMTVREISKRTGLKPGSISGWLYNNLGISTPKITWVKRGTYTYCSNPEAELDG